MHPGAHPPIRVLAVGPSAKGGVSRLLDAVRAELADHPPADVRLRSLTTRADVRGRFGSAIASPCIFAMALVREIALLATGRIDVVHVNLASYGSTYRKLAIATCAAMFGVPYVIHLHGGNFRAFWSSCGVWLARRIDVMFEGAARIIVMSRSALDLVAERLPACRAAIVVLPNAAPRGRPRKPDRDDGVRILFLGKLGPLKGVGELVAALDLLRSEPAWSATIAGDGAVAETRSTVDRLGLSARIAVPGWLGQADVARALENADVLVLPSHVENSPLAVIEAFAHGLAVVATPVGAIPELVDDGHTGILVRPGDARALADALRRLIADPELRRRLGANANCLSRAGPRDRPLRAPVGRRLADCRGSCRSMPVKPLSSVHWYANRLAAMSGAEVVHRAREQIRRMADRADRAAWRRFEVGDGPLVALPALRRAFQVPWPDAVADRASASATLLAAGHLPLLGRNWPEDMMRSHPSDLWFWDPISRTAWPGAERFAFDVARNDGGRRDARYVWEMNRLQLLHPPVALAIRSGDAEGARTAVETVLAWADANPPFRGINWASGIELALRLVSVALVVAAAGNALDRHARGRLRALVAAHGFWISRYPSLYSSANNHRLAEGLGLLVAALLAPDLAPASFWAAEGRRILMGTGRTLFHADGIGAEQSPTYAAFALEMIALGAVLDPAVLNAEARGWLARAAGALRTMLDDAGNTPRIGDDDEGRVISLPPDREPRYVASVVAGIAGLLVAPELAPPVRDPHLRDLLFRSPAAGSASADGVHHFRDGGYTVIRETVAGHRAMIVFDHGPLGFSSIAAHGHADALAVWLHLDGVPVLIDAGTGHYASSGTWRELFRSTAAHNTVTINDGSQSLTSGAFNWRHKAKTRVTAFSGGRDWSITARHDGYARRFGVEHERMLRRVDGGFAIEDRLIGSKPGLGATGRLLVGPTCTASVAAPGTVVVEDARSVKLSLCFRGGSVSLEPSAPYSGGFGEWSTATALVFQLAQGEPSSTITVRFV